MKISGYVPCFNAAETVLQAVWSVRGQRPELDEVFVVDDGSTDGSAERITSAGLKVIAMGKNCGRGAARARAFEEAKGDLVLSCDATARLAADFSARALPHFEDEKVAAVYGRFVDENPKGASGRWRNRHLFKWNEPSEVEHHAPLITWGVLMRKRAVMEVGNFDPKCRHSEDAELGARLEAKGWDIVYEPEATLAPLTHHCVRQVLERYWRWHVGHEEKVNFSRYFSQLVYAHTIMARKDLAERDPWGALITFATPHYFVWRMFVRR